MYFQKTYKAGKTVEIHKGYSAREGRKYQRGEGEGVTPPAMADYNEKLSRRKLVRLINENFCQDDVHMVLRWPKNARPTPEYAAAELEKAKRTMRRRMKAAGRHLDYVSTTAIGERGALHHHLVTNLTDLALMRDIWTHGSVHMTRLYSSGDYSGLAKYFCGQEKGEEGGRIIIFGNRWSCSRGLTRTEPTRKTVHAESWREPPTAWKGYAVDVDSIELGVNPVNGAPYLFYRMVKLPQARTAAQLQQVEALREAAAKRLHAWWQAHKAQKIIQRGGGDTVALYRACPLCGANLDPGEKCDCAATAETAAHIPREECVTDGEHPAGA